MTTGTGKYLGRFSSRNCIHCEEEFNPASGGQKFCSSECRQRTWLYRTYHNEISRKHRVTYKERHRYTRQRRKYWIDKYKEARGCDLCGCKDEAICFDFDHIDPNTKRFTIGNCYKRLLKDLIIEIRKCRLLCAMCHRKETQRKNQWGFRKINETT